MSLAFSAVKKPMVQLRAAVGRRAAADAGLDGPGDDLVERRIAGHRVRQLARQVGIGAAELDGRRRAAALAVAGVDVDGGRRAERDAGGRVEPAERVIGVERAGHAGPDAIHVVDARPVVAAREREVPRAAERQRVRAVGAPGVRRPSRSMRVSYGSPSTLAAGHAVSVRVHAGDAPVGDQVAQLRGLLEADAAAVVRAAGRELVAEPPRAIR